MTDLARLVCMPAHITLKMVSLMSPLVKTLRCIFGLYYQAEIDLPKELNFQLKSLVLSVLASGRENFLLAC